MKKTFLFLSLISYLLFLISPVYAVTATPTPKDNLEELRDQLITNIASRVAQLKLVEKRGIIGKVTETTNTQITVSDLQNNTRFIDVDELTKFSSEDAKSSFGISDIKVNDTIGVLGLYNKDSRRILARFVNVIETPQIIHGGVVEIDSENFTITIATIEGKEIIVDVESTTRTFSYTNSLGNVKSGFSKIEENSNIIVTGIVDSSEENRITAERILFFPEIPANLKIISTSKNSAKKISE